MSRPMLQPSPAVAPATLEPAALAAVPRLLPLLRTLSAQSPAVAVWKNADPALDGVGDVDLVAPEHAWPAILDVMRAWAADAGLGPLLVCRHLPGALFAIALDGDREYVQLDVRSRATYRGGVVFRAEELVGMLVMDPRGFRRLRPGAEGVLKLVLKGASPAGHPRRGNLRAERVRELIAADPDGVRLAAALFAPATEALVGAAERYQRHEWDRRSMLAVELVCRSRALREPLAVLRRSRARALARRECPLVQGSLRGERRPGADRDDWLRHVHAAHGERRRGGVVLLAGPDGVGKTTVCAGLARSAPEGVPVQVDRRAMLPRRTKGAVTEPHRHAAYPAPLSFAKTFYYYADALLNWTLRVRPAVRDGVWLVRERGWWDMAVDPRRYRLRPHPRLFRLLGRLLPAPDLVVVLEGGAEAIHARKPELPPDEIARQCAAWHRLLPADQRHIFVDVAAPAEEVIARAARELALVAGWPGGSRAESAPAAVHGAEEG